MRRQLSPSYFMAMIGYFIHGTIYKYPSNLVFVSVLFYNFPSSICLHASEVELVLNVHNNVRRQMATYGDDNSAANMNKLAWDTTLQRSAENRMTCDENFILYEANANGLFMNIGSSVDENLTSIIHSWIHEENRFLPEYGVCRDVNGCDHFLKMIHADHDRIGCAFRERCASVTGAINVLLCLYGGGETVHPPYRKGPPCTKCREPHSFCDHGLCVSCGDPSGSQCDCRKTCRMSGIGVGHLSMQNCTCTCTYGRGPNCDEDCVNPESYIDFDICGYVSEEECKTSDPEIRELLLEYCPAQCANCRRHPLARLMLNKTSPVKKRG